MKKKDIAKKIPANEFVHSGHTTRFLYHKDKKNVGENYADSVLKSTGIHRLQDKRSSMEKSSKSVSRHIKKLIKKNQHPFIWNKPR